MHALSYSWHDRISWHDRMELCLLAQLLHQDVITLHIGSSSKLSKYVLRRWRSYVPIGLRNPSALTDDLPADPPGRTSASRSARAFNNSRHIFSRLSFSRASFGLRGTCAEAISSMGSSSDLSAPNGGRYREESCVAVWPSAWGMGVLGNEEDGDGMAMSTESSTRVGKGPTWSGRGEAVCGGTGTAGKPRHRGCGCISGWSGA